MFRVLGQRNFALLWTGGLISSIGDLILFVALPFYVYTVSGSTVATGAMFLAETLPRLLLGSVAGVFVDRWDRRLTMLLADVLRAGLLLTLLAVHSADTLWLVYVVAAAESSVGQFFDPARGALLPRLLPAADDLLQANSLSAMNGAVTQLAGPALGGVLFTAVGLQGVVLADSFSFLCSAAMIFLIRVPQQGEQGSPVTRIGSGIGAVLHEWRVGMRLVAHDSLLRKLFVILGAATLGQGIINVLIVIFVKENLHGTAQTFGWLVTAQGAGGLIGGLLVGQIGKKIRPAYLMLIGGFFAGLGMTIMVLASSLPVTLVVIVPTGFLIVGYFVSATTLLQQAAPDEARGRVFGALNTANAVLMLIGIGFASAFGTLWGAGPTLAIAGLLYAASGLLALTLRSESRTETASAPAPELATATPLEA